MMSLLEYVSWQQSDNHQSENEGPNPSAPASHDRAVKYKLSEVAKRTRVYAHILQNLNHFFTHNDNK